jgi:ubiquinone/menaquinone biosynthesis C-methylase UbiE
MWEPSTLRIFQKISLCEGMRCLDVGCGPGDVMRLMGELIGPTGHITGIDADGNAGRQAIEMLRSATESHFTFIEQDLETAVDIPGYPFDLTYARFAIYHLQDPLAMLRKMFAWTKPGGYIARVDTCGASGLCNSRSRISGLWIGFGLELLAARTAKRWVTRIGVLTNNGINSAMNVIAPTSPFAYHPHDEIITVEQQLASASHPPDRHRCLSRLPDSRHCRAAGGLH